MIAAIVDKAVEIEALAHVAEEILLRPSPKHRRRQHRSRCPVVGGQECRLMPALGELAALARPQTVAEPGAALGQPDRDLLPRGHAYLGCDELIAWPILARIFVIGQAGNAPLLHLREEPGAVALPIEHNGEAVQQRV